MTTSGRNKTDSRVRATYRPATLHLKNMSDASTIFSRFHLAEEACVRLLNISTGCSFKRSQGYVLKATKPCVVAYGCARIRRLVRLGVTR